MERSASDTGESPLALATRARREVSGRQEARATILSQSSCGAQFNTAQYRPGEQRMERNLTTIRGQAVHPARVRTAKPGFAASSVDDELKVRGVRRVAGRRNPRNRNRVGSRQSSRRWRRRQRLRRTTTAAGGLQHQEQNDSRKRQGCHDSLPPCARDPRQQKAKQHRNKHWHQSRPRNHAPVQWRQRRHASRHRRHHDAGRLACS